MHSTRRARMSPSASEQLRELNIGATAVGTGLNAGDEYRRLVVAESLALYQAAARAGVQSVSRHSKHGRRARVFGCDAPSRRGAGKNRQRSAALSMGPRAGLSEISLPAVQPGSSIMPGKVNPSVPEMVNQVCFQVIGCDTTIMMAAEAGQLELNVMMPVIAWNALHASTILRRIDEGAADRCVDGIAANEARARELLERSTAAATALSPYIGYAKTAEIAKEAVKTGRTDPRARPRTRPARCEATRRDPFGRGDDERRSRRRKKERVGRVGQVGQVGRVRQGGRVRR